MQFDINVAQDLLSKANQHFVGMLPAANSSAQQQQQQPRISAVAEHAKEYVSAIGGIQQQLVRFAAPVPTTSRAQVEQEVSALQQELTRADALLQETIALVQEWQRRCQALRDTHEAVLTQGIAQGAPEQLPAVAPAAQ